MSNEIVCVGEILWDALPDGLFLGGAPFNVASHLRALHQRVTFASRVGDDRLGHEALRRMQARGLKTEFVQVDSSLPTGFVEVALENSGEPDYEILEPAAWDAVTFTDSLVQHARNSDTLVYGSLAQRALTSRETIRQLWEADLLRVFDVNLRPPFIDSETIRASLEAADIVKCNDDELQRMMGWFDLPRDVESATAAVAATFDCSCVCVTAGSEGAWLWMNGDTSRHSGYPVDVEDTVGAGDAFLAALITGLIGGWKGADLLDHANRLGAFVASRSGALPAYPAGAFDEISELVLDT
ncbi:fructokinase [Salinibacter ruber]|jgi:fructokinase|uniref:carbohydrate kinase family protein n=1 Tax=Salinibacter ruber TaxID=146919 RepID=UPI0013C3195A|nr:carbohydrate kinase [Salinibacter ruber]MCS4034541.1 fructokinase [Salinibacter ruber]